MNPSPTPEGIRKIDSSQTSLDHERESVLYWPEQRTVGQNWLALVIFVLQSCHLQAALFIFRARCDRWEASVLRSVCCFASLWTPCRSEHCTWKGCKIDGNQWVGNVNDKYCLPHWDFPGRRRTSCFFHLSRSLNPIYCFILLRPLWLRWPWPLTFSRPFISKREIEKQTWLSNMSRSVYKVTWVQI